MANTFTQIYMHIVFAVKRRNCMISKDWKDSLYSYMGGILRNMGCHAIRIGGVEDHVHILTTIDKNITLPKVVQTLKTGASSWIKSQNYIVEKFEWQDGYSAFSVSASSVNAVKNYIENQDLHHRRLSFREELIEFLNAYGIQYDARYLPGNPMDID